MSTEAGAADGIRPGARRRDSGEDAMMSHRWSGGGRVLTPHKPAEDLIYARPPPEPANPCAPDANPQVTGPNRSSGTHRCNDFTAFGGRSTRAGPPNSVTNQRHRRSGAPAASRWCCAALSTSMMSRVQSRIQCSGCLRFVDVARPLGVDVEVRQLTARDGARINVICVGRILVHRCVRCRDGSVALKAPPAGTTRSVEG